MHAVRNARKLAFSGVSGYCIKSVVLMNYGQNLYDMGDEAALVEMERRRKPGLKNPDGTLLRGA